MTEVMTVRLVVSDTGTQWHVEGFIDAPSGFPIEALYAAARWLTDETQVLDKAANGDASDA